MQGLEPSVRSSAPPAFVPTRPCPFPPFLPPGSPLLIQQEPDNEHDAQAVLLCDLAGRRLGYVPRADTDQFPHPLVVGRVESVGASPTSGLWGFQV